ncbi:MAG TPA: LapA family protein [Burkholderiales bacterium]|nr:LapA family protein [Burkholderiales bacterium]
MRYFLQLLKFVVLGLLLILAVSFAVKNAEMVSVRYYLGQEWQAPLVLVLLTFFCLGVIVGFLASLGRLVRQRRQIATLNRQVRTLQQRSAAAPAERASDIP